MKYRQTYFSQTEEAKAKLNDHLEQYKLPTQDQILQHDHDVAVFEPSNDDHSFFQTAAEGQRISPNEMVNHTIADHLTATIHNVAKTLQRQNHSVQIDLRPDCISADKINDKLMYDQKAMTKIVLTHLFHKVYLAYEMIDEYMEEHRELKHYDVPLMFIRTLSYKTIKIVGPLVREHFSELEGLFRDPEY